MVRAKPSMFNGATPVAPFFVRAGFRKIWP